MSAADTTVYQFNFKIGNDLHNIYATNGEEAVELLAYFEENILPAITSVQQKASATGAVAPVIPLAPAAQQTVTAPAPVADPGGAPLCEHGQPAKLIAAGISKSTGKPYKAFYACNQPRGAQCNFRASA